MYSASVARRKTERKKRKEPKRLFKANIREINKMIKEAVKDKFSYKTIFCHGMDAELIEKIRAYYKAKGYEVGEKERQGYNYECFVIRWGA